MDNVLRCSIIFVILHMFSINFGLASINPITKTMFNNAIRPQNQLDSIFSSEPDDRDVPRLRVRNPLTNFDNYDFDDYYHDGEEPASNENTQSVDSDYDDEYEEDESLMSVDKRSRHVPSRQGKRTNIHEDPVDLCPVVEESYKINETYKRQGFKLRFQYKELACNHSTIHPGYHRQYNRICYSLGRTFEHGHDGQGTHCYQRYITKDIEIRSISGDRGIYPEAHFKYGCTCGWSTDELGSIRDYHFDKILNLCSQIRDKV